MKLYELYKKEKLLEIEINPLLINEREAYAVDIRFVRQ
jgi:succinyl-CoA synthetase beta subunit